MVVVGWDKLSSTFNATFTITVAFPGLGHHSLGTRQEGDLKYITSRKGIRNSESRYIMEETMLQQQYDRKDNLVINRFVLARVQCQCLE